MNQNKPKIIGHRGAAGLVFENTLNSMLKAIELGVSCIEFDVWMTTDGELFVFHDAYLDRLTNETGFTAEISTEKLKQLRLKNGDEIPTLKEIVAIAKARKVQLLVEVKAENAFEETLKILEKELPYSAFIVGSFYHTPIMDLKKANPELQTSIMFEGVPAMLEDYLEMVNPDYVTASIDTVNNSLADTVKSQGRRLLLYTVNTEAEIKLAREASPYGIITNYPNLFPEELQAPTF
jgi:glycerophosphoryl diester phosphodiesterase